MKFSKALLLLAAATALAGNYEKLFANDKGELFTDYSLALNSVGFDTERITTLTPENWEGIDPKEAPAEPAALTGEDGATQTEGPEAQEEAPAPKKSRKK